MRRFILLFSLLFTTPAAAQMVHTYGTVPENRENYTLTYAWLSHVLGFTICLHDAGFAYIRAGQSEMERLDTEKHESVHQEQFRRMGCAGADKFMSTLKGRVLIEAEAYAAGLCVQVARGAVKSSLERYNAEKISSWITDGQVSPFSIIPILRAFETC